MNNWNPAPYDPKPPSPSQQRVWGPDGVSRTVKEHNQLYGGGPPKRPTAVEAVLTALFVVRK